MATVYGPVKLATPAHPILVEAYDLFILGGAIRRYHRHLDKMLPGALEDLGLTCQVHRLSFEGQMEVMVFVVGDQALVVSNFEHGRELHMAVAKWPFVDENDNELPMPPLSGSFWVPVDQREGPQHHKVTILWNGGWEDYRVDMANVRDMTEEEQSRYDRGSYPTFSTSEGTWIRGRFVHGRRDIVPVGVEQCIRITAHLGGGD